MITRLLFALVLMGVFIIAPLSAQYDSPAVETLTHADHDWDYLFDYDSSLSLWRGGDGTASIRIPGGDEVYRIACYHNPASPDYAPLVDTVDWTYDNLDGSSSEWELYTEDFSETWQGFDAAEIYYETMMADGSWLHEVDYIVEASDNIYILSMTLPDYKIGDYWDEFYLSVYSFEIFWD